MAIAAGSQPVLDPAEIAAAQLRVRRYLRFLGCGRGSVDDLVQETLLAATARAPGRLPPLPWLLTTARNCLRMQLRRAGRRREVVDLDRLHRSWIEQAGDDGGDAMRSALRTCLGELPPRTRLALQLRYGEGASRAAIAARIGVGEQGLKSLLARARAGLAVCIQRRLRDG